METSLIQLRDALAARATQYDRDNAWPDDSLRHLKDAGAWRWMIPKRYGGLELDPIAHLYGYEAVAAGCLASLLILANRDGACELIAASENDALKEKLLPALADNRILATVAISQLTTSHQSGPPALTARPDGDGFRFNGFMPWVTSAVKCQFIVSGAVLPDGMQVLVAMPTDCPGLSIEPPMELMTMQGTLTSEVRCCDVFVAKDHLLRGPAPKVLSTRSGVKPSLVAASGVGLAGSMVKLINQYTSKTGGAWLGKAEDLEKRHQSVRNRVYEFAAAKNANTAEHEKTQIRIAVNDLLMRLCIALLTYTKGTGFLKTHDAQRLAREALFFLAWAAPEDVRAGTLAAFM